VTFKDHFSETAASYAQFRPRYPERLMDWLAGVAPGRALAWDAATGNGQAALVLADRFARVVATDASAEQIANAPPHPRVEYRVARAEAGGLDAETCDLVTVAQALHWLEPAAFFSAAHSALRPRGLVAVWCYVDPHLVDADVDDALQEFAVAVKSYWPPERAITDDGYRSLPFPFDEIPSPPFELDMTPTLAEFVGYLRTWSATRRFMVAHRDDPVLVVERRLAKVWPVGEQRTLRWPLHLRAGVRRT
jgi:SAM-dependent methyltransferase